MFLCYYILNILKMFVNFIINVTIFIFIDLLEVLIAY